MTFVGKILVIIITIFAMFFLALSTVVFMTERDWKAEAEKLRANISDLNKKKSAAEAEIAKRTDDLKAEQDKSKRDQDLLQARIDALTKDIEARQRELTEQRTTVATATESAKAALAEAEARKKETDQLRQQLAAVQQQANEFKIRQMELTDQIRILTRQLETAQNNNRSLRETVGLLRNTLRTAGLSDDVTQIKGVRTAPPDVEGTVLRVDSRNERVEISIGSDDGLVSGHELEVYRLQPAPEYLGRIRINAVEPDRAVGSVVGKTVQGKRIVEGDLVSSTIRNRS